MPNSLVISTDHEDTDPRTFSFAIRSNSSNRIAFVHMTDDAAMKVAYRIMALASCGGNAREVFEGESNGAGNGIHL